MMHKLTNWKASRSGSGLRLTGTDERGRGVKVSATLVESTAAGARAILANGDQIQLA